MMTLERLQELCAEALCCPPKELVKRCGRYYSPYYHLMWLVSHELSQNGPLLAVELGVEKGRGLTAIALGAHFKKDVRIVGFDTTRRKEIDSLTATFPNIDFREKPSLPPTNLEQPINVLHIDTEHSFAMAREEFNHWKDQLASGAVVLFDDLHAMDDGVLDFFNTLPYPKIQEDRLHPTCGYGVLLFVDNDQEPGSTED